MRLAIVCLIAAIMLVTAAVARSSTSHKEGKRHHQQQQQQQQQQQPQAIDLMRQLDRSWNNISTFPIIGEEGITQSIAPQPTTTRVNGGGKKKKSSGAKNKQEWDKKHKRKMASLQTMAEQDRRLSLMHLPRLPAATPTSARFAEQKSQATGLECCPTVVEMVQPSGGTNMEGHVVELYRHGDLDQRIYEHSCRPDVLNQPCRFVEKLLRPLSRCVQQFSFTYAVVSDHPAGNEWRLDYIRIRNGCACEIQPP
ncbi:uncharacterized protein LOC130701155 [Daphnia carinata]|uniref:uncharacterized protein LOC130701155 n=1 Tax=Daphnia carinata TaxID=120202 RepID=UPI00257CB09B|nr:uncharacterized protein LOC130701155 [Daphnia carinata]